MDPRCAALPRLGDGGADGFLWGAKRARARVCSGWTVVGLQSVMLSELWVCVAFTHQGCESRLDYPVMQELEGVS